MPKFLVFFSGPVVDQPDHPRVARPLPVGTALVVQAADAVAACFHAARVTRGDAHPTGVYTAAGQLAWGEGAAVIDPIAVAPPPLPEVVRDRPIVEPSTDPFAAGVIDA